MSQTTHSLPKCPGENCPIKKHCALFVSKGNGHLTVWSHSPFDHTTGDCSEYLPIKPLMKGVVVRHQ